MRRFCWTAPALLLALNLTWAQNPAPTPTPTPEPPAADGPLVVLPERAEGVPGEWIVVSPLRTVGGAPKWWLGKGLTKVDVGKLLKIQGDLGGVVVKSGVPGVYELWAWNAKGDVASEASLCLVTVTGAVPPAPPVPPGPTPPGPGPTPEPISTSPFAEPGLRVLVSYEDNVARTPAQLSVLSPSKELRDWLNAHCAPDPTGRERNADGTVMRDWRVWPSGTDPALARKVFRDAWANKGPEKKDWLLVGDGRVGYSGPLPRTDVEALAILRKIGGP